MSLKKTKNSLLKDNILEWTKKYEKHEFDIDLNKLKNIFMNIIIKFIINENCHNTCIKYLNNKERKYIHGRFLF